MYIGEVTFGHASTDLQSVDPENQNRRDEFINQMREKHGPDFPLPGATSSGVDTWTAAATTGDDGAVS